MPGKKLTKSSRKTDSLVVGMNRAFDGSLTTTKASVKKRQQKTLCEMLGAKSAALSHNPAP
jgi:hypothetical protein